MVTSTAKNKLDPHVLKTALVLAIGALAVVFDTTIVSVALHPLAQDLHTTVATIQWVTTGYLLALGVAVPLSTWALGRFGGKRVWMFALAVFLLGSLGSSLAWNVGSLIGWRVVQGVGGGLMLPVMATLVFQAAKGKALGRTAAWVALPALLGPILGPLVGGAILTNLSWRFLFWVNIPFCTAGLIFAGIYLAKDVVPAVRPRLDVWGLALRAPSIAAIVLALSNAGSSAGFTQADVIVPLVIGVVLLIAFVVYTLRRSDPLVDIRLLSLRSVGSSSSVLFLSGFALYGAMLLLPLYYMEVRGTTALTAGLILVPQGIGTLFSRQIAGPLTDKIGARSIAAVGFLIVAAATVPFCFVTGSTSDWLLALALLVRGIGLGAVTMPVMTAAYVGLRHEQVAHSSVLTRIAQQLGGSFGTAVLAVILEYVLTTDGGTDLVGAFHVSFWWATGFAVVAMVLCVWLPGRKQVEAAAAVAEAADAAAAEAAAKAQAQAQVPIDESSPTPVRG
jgi:EmrB/QacA subfamily drug resistance transporter